MFVRVFGGDVDDWSEPRTDLPVAVKEVQQVVVNQIH